MADEVAEIVMGLVGAALLVVAGVLRLAVAHPRVTAVLSAVWLLVEVTR
jgi:hypothetical protein